MWPSLPSSSIITRSHCLLSNYVSPSWWLPLFYVSLSHPHHLIFASGVTTTTTKCFSSSSSNIHLLLVSVLWIFFVCELHRFVFVFVMHPLLLQNVVHSPPICFPLPLSHFPLPFPLPPHQRQWRWPLPPNNCWRRFPFFSTFNTVLHPTLLNFSSYKTVLHLTQL